MKEKKTNSRLQILFLLKTDITPSLFSWKLKLKNKTQRSRAGVKGGGGGDREGRDGGRENSKGKNKEKIGERETKKSGTPLAFWYF